MNSKIVVGVGNIYANEALFHAKIHPQRLVNTISPLQYQVIATSVKKILKQAIRRGGTTLRNFQDSSGKPGYFKQQLTVYGRGNKPCVACEHLLQEIRLAQRTTVYCPSCQPFNLLS
jgi:formamidopyrimidine-DNA glycosylase